MYISHFSELGLAKPIQRALHERKYENPTPIQSKAIPVLMNGRDVLGIAQTGTGKTAAFALPILHKLYKNRKSAESISPRALILAPTRELAIQIGRECKAYGKYLHLRQALIYGGVSQKPQVKALNRGVDIVIATPGRLLDLINQQFLRLDKVEFFVLDEADRMLDMGFLPDINKVINKLSKSRQSLLFSATMPKAIASLAKQILANPLSIEVAPQATPIERIQQNVYHSHSGEKTELLINILSDPRMSRVLVFTRTKHRANRVVEKLAKSGIKADAIHGNKSQSARQLALKRFRGGNIRVLVATDIAARGIDVDNVSHVINYELPNEPENYIHRIGRTARAGADGIALSFCDPSERVYLHDIEHLIGIKIMVLGKELPGVSGPEKAKQKKSRKYSWKQRKRNIRNANGPNNRKKIISNRARKQQVAT
ncbi:MAG: DEAD/DEAH box helicase [Alphaproteobacteria bacterium]